MKKRYIVLVIVAIIILIISIGFIITKNVTKSRREYNIEQVENYNYFILKQNNKFGVIDTNGKILIESKFDSLIMPNPSKAIFICKNDNNTIVLNDKGEEIFKEYKNIDAIRLKNIASDLMYEKSVLKFESDGKYGLINLDGKQILKPDYNSIEGLSYKEGELLVQKDEKCGIVNIKGNELVKCEYDKISVDNYYTEENNYKYAGYIVGIKTEEGYRYGYINVNGKLLLDTQYNEISRITDIKDDKNIYLISAKNGQYGLTKNGEKLTDNEYQSMTYNPNMNVIVVEKSKKYGVINLSGKVIVPIEYNQIDINGMYMYATKEQGTVVFDSEGNEAKINVDLVRIKTENENYIITINTKNGQTNYGVIDKQGKQIIEEEYSYIEYLFENYFIASNKEGKLGIIDSKDNQKVELKYDAVQRISNKNMVQTIQSDIKTTQIYSDKLEKVCEMTNANIDRQENYVKIYNDTEIKYFDNTGNQLKNTDIFTGNELFAKEENGKYGFADKIGNIKIECKYDKVTEFNKYGFAGIKQNGKWGIINKEGIVIVEPVYEITNQIEPDFIGSYYKVTYGFGEFYYTDAK